LQQESVWERPADYNPPHLPSQAPMMMQMGGGMGGGGGGGGGAANMGPCPTVDGQQRKGPAGSNLFVVKIPDGFTDKDLFDTFTPFGTVTRCQITTDKHTGESKGFGFVSYQSSLEADAAVENMNGATVQGRRLKVEKSRDAQAPGNPY